MVLSQLTDLFLTFLYLNLGWITYKTLKIRQKSSSTMDRILLKWITSAILFSTFPLIQTVVYFIPLYPLKLLLGCWILLPQFHGEYTNYYAWSTVLEKLENVFGGTRTKICWTIFETTFSICVTSFKLSKKYVLTSELKMLQQQIRGMEGEVTKELGIRKKIRLQMQGL